jgi:hypothetical protein
MQRMYGGTELPLYKQFFHTKVTQLCHALFSTDYVIQIITRIIEKKSTIFYDQSSKGRLGHI